MRASVVVVATLLMVQGAAAQRQPNIPVGEAQAQIRRLETRHGVGDVRTTAPMIELALGHWHGGRRAEAMQLLRRVVAIREQANGRDDRGLLAPLVNLGLMLRGSQRHAEIVQVFRRAIALQRAYPDSAVDARLLAIMHYWVGNGLAEQGRGTEARQAYEASIPHRMRALAAARPGAARAAALNDLAWSQYRAGRTDEAIASQRLAVETRAPLGESVELGDLLADLGGMLREAGDLRAGAEHIERGVAMIEARGGAVHQGLVTPLTTLGTIQNRMGRWHEARATLTRAVALAERHHGATSAQAQTAMSVLGRVLTQLQETDEAAALLDRMLRAAETSEGARGRRAAEALRALAALRVAERRHEEAEQLLRRGLEFREAAMGADHHSVGWYTIDLATILLGQNRAAEALVFAARTQRLFEAALGQSLQYANATVLAARAMNANGQFAAGEAQGRRALAIYLQQPVAVPLRAAQARVALATALTGQGRAAEALAEAEAALRGMEDALGTEHAALSGTLATMARALEAGGRLDDALAAMRRAARLNADFAAAGDGEQITERAPARALLVDFVRLDQAARGGAADDDAFAAAQLAQASATAAAITAMAERAGADDPALSALLRRAADARARQQQLERQLQAQAELGIGANVAALRRGLAAARAEVAALDGQIARDHPRFQRLVAGRPVALAEVQAVLRPDEAVINYLLGPDASFAFVIRRDGSRLARLTITEEAAAAAVRALRVGLNTEALAAGGALPRYDVERAHALYQSILEPLIPDLRGVAHLIIVPDRALQSLPFAVLVDQPPAPGADADYAATSWLARRFADSAIPSAAALVALRVQAGASRARDPFIGFGDPLLQGPPSQGPVDPNRVFTRSGGADVAVLRQLPPLPDTREELQALATTLNAPEAAIFAGARATERQVRAAPLRDFRVVAFATHGLVGGELRGRAEPGLVLTPPAAPSPEDDGVLTATEIMGLRLDSDWVILSACNTAASDGTPGADALSGLARAFFHAGSRSLLVSHWSVASDAARLLTAAMLAHAREPGVSRAEALRRSMIGLAAQERFAHPLMWAPFTIVGEGGELR